MSSDVDHKARSHSELSASGTERWWACPGSVRASEGIPDTSSKWAEEGTAAHELANLCLENGQDAIEYVDRQVHGYWVVENDEAVKASGDTLAVAAEPVQVYLDECRRYIGPGWEHWIERRFSLESLKPPVPMFGTSDFCAYNAEERLLVVVDYKHGAGIAKDAEGNPQLRYYALGASLAMPPRTPISRVRTTIVQPRLFGGQRPIKTAEIDAVELVEWSIQLLEYAHLTQAPDAPFHAGEHCRFCKVSPCREQARAATEAAAVEFEAFADEGTHEVLVQAQVPDPMTLSGEQIGLILTRLPILEGFAKAVRERALDMLTRGQAVPGWMATPTRATRKWDLGDEAMIPEMLMLLFGLTDEQVFARKTKSPAQIEAVLEQQLRTKGLRAGEAKAQAKALTKGMIRSESSGAKLAPEHPDAERIAARGDEFAEFCVDAPNTIEGVS